VTSQGLALAFCSVSTNISGSYTFPSDKLMLGRLNGLKLQAHVPPLSLSMVSTPLGPLLDEVVVDVELPRRRRRAAHRRPIARRSVGVS
jgi:hypothetical protein